MQITLITGLDGSGKSTIFSALESKKANSSFEVLKLPLIDSQILKDNVTLQKVAEFINIINLKADKDCLPKLKAIALFASMLLFKKLIEHKNKPTIKKIYCERHPLIDSGVYSLFYADKAKTDATHKSGFEKINIQYRNEIEYILKLIPVKFFAFKKPELECLAGFIYSWFFIDKQSDVFFLKELFGVDLPNKIFYLKAKPEILIERLSNRNFYEAHESIKILSDLYIAYDLLFEKMSLEKPGLLNIIDANSIKNLNEFREFIESDCRK